MSANQRLAWTIDVFDEETERLVEEHELKGVTVELIEVEEVDTECFEEKPRFQIVLLNPVDAVLTQHSAHELVENRVR